MKSLKCIFFFTLFLCLTIMASAQINPKKILEKKAAEKVNKELAKKPAPVADTAAVEKKDPTSPSRTDTIVKPATEQPSIQTYSKYDFIPGEKVIFFDDFTQDNIGDFPALWNTNGSGEVVTTNLFPGRWLQFVSRNSIWTDALLNLPDNYTIEFDIIPIKGTEGGMGGYNFRMMQSINEKAFDHGSVPGKAGLVFGCEYFGRPGYRTYINSEDGRDLGLTGHSEDRQYFQKENQKYHIAIWIQRSRVRIYMNENKLFDLPKAFPLVTVKMDRIRFEDGAALVSNVRIAVGAPDMRNKLLTEGKIVSYGIYFDVNKDVVKPESYGSLKEIAAILVENSGIKIQVVGHTDADGADDVNLDLSKRRATSVKKELVNSFGIEASRIETDGKGETKAVAPNDTPANKALNRRVEFIKL